MTINVGDSLRLLADAAERLIAEVGARRWRPMENDRRTIVVQRDRSASAARRTGYQRAARRHQ
jgi:hypothetical protein